MGIKLESVDISATEEEIFGSEYEKKLILKKRTSRYVLHKKAIEGN